MRVLSAVETTEKIKLTCQERGKSVSELSRDIGMSGNNLYKLLSGSVQKLPSDLIAKIAVALDVDCDYLLTDSTEEKKCDAEAASQIGLSASSVRYIRSLDHMQRTGLDAVLNKQSGLSDLLRVFGEQKMFGSAFQKIQKSAENFRFNEEPTSYDMLIYKTAHLSAKIVDWLRRS